MLAFIQDNEIEKYPISLGDLQERFPNTSFGMPLNASDLVDYGVVEIEELPIPEYDLNLQRITRKEPENIDGNWVISYEVTNIPQEELDSIAEQQRIINEENVRNLRNNLLSQSDWTQLPDARLTPDQKLSWENYRQELRDVPQQEGFAENVIWPDQP
jgi:hypothetical protein